MAGPLMGILNQAGGAMFGTQVGQALGGLADRGAHRLRHRPAARPRGQGGAGARQRARLRRGPRRRATRTSLLYLAAARGRPPAAVRPRAVAARPPARGRGGLRPRHQHRRVEDRGVDARHRPDEPRRPPGGARRRPVRAGEDPGAAGRAHPAGDHARAGRGLGRRRGRPGHRGPDAVGGQAPGGGTPPPCRGRTRPSRPSPRSSGSSCVRAGCATPPRCGARCAAGRATRPATPSGRTPTCSPPRPTSTTRWASARSSPSPRRSPTPSSTPPWPTCSTARTPARPRPRPDDETDRRQAPAATADVTDLHTDALATLRGWAAPDADQERLRAAYVAHLERHPDGIDAPASPTT